MGIQAVVFRCPYRNKTYPDVDVGSSLPIKQHLYRMNTFKKKFLKEKIQYLLDNNFIQPVKVHGVHHAFLCQNLTSLTGCVQTTEKLKTYQNR